MKIGYAKLGRNLQFKREKFGFQGDVEAPRLLMRLAKRNPTHEWVVVGKNTGFDDYGFPANVTNIWRNDVPRAPYVHQEDEHRCAFCKTQMNPDQVHDCCDQGRYAYGYHKWVSEVMGTLDAFVIHIGQHGNTHGPIPPANKTWASGERTNTYAWARNYGRYLLQGLNLACDRTDGEIPIAYICADPRNYMKPRDLKWPARSPILSQYMFQRESKHERFLDMRAPDAFDPPWNAKQERGGELWVAMDQYIYAGPEMLNLPVDWRDWGLRSFDDRRPAGVATTAFWAGFMKEARRSWIIKNYLLHAFPGADLFGKWDDKSIEEVGQHVYLEAKSMFVDRLSSWRVTVALPAPSQKKQDVRWVTAKPWQCFAARTVCFMLFTDAQGWVVPTTKKPPEGKHMVEVSPGLWSCRNDWTEDELYLARWLRVKDPDDFAKKAQAVVSSKETWEWLVTVQRRLVERRWEEFLIERSIERTLGIG
jgi:hypothetical protein